MKRGQLQVFRKLLHWIYPAQKIKAKIAIVQQCVQQEKKVALWVIEQMSKKETGKELCLEFGNVWSKPGCL